MTSTDRSSRGKLQKPKNDRIKGERRSRCNKIEDGFKGETPTAQTLLCADGSGWTRQDYAAAIIQKNHRGYTARRRFRVAKFLREHRSAYVKQSRLCVLLQSWWRVKLAQKKRFRLKRDRAARVIQTWWAQLGRFFAYRKLRVGGRTNVKQKAGKAAKRRKPKLRQLSVPARVVYLCDSETQWRDEDCDPRRADPLSLLTPQQRRNIPSFAQLWTKPHPRPPMKISKHDSLRIGSPSCRASPFGGVPSPDSAAIRDPWSREAFLEAALSWNVAKGAEPKDTESDNDVELRRMFPEIPRASSIPAPLRKAVNDLEARKETQRDALAQLKNAPDFARFASLQKEAHPILLEPLVHHKLYPGAAYKPKRVRQKQTRTKVVRAICSDPIIFAAVK
jgi:hypothetical protein